MSSMRSMRSSSRLCGRSSRPNSLVRIPRVQKTTRPHSSCPASALEYNTTQSTKRSTYRRRVAAAKKAATGDPADASAMSADTTALDDSMADGGPDAMPRAKKMKTAEDDSQMDLDDEEGGHDASDAETMPDENEEEEEEEDDDVVEEEQEDDDEEDQAEGEDRDELEERDQGPDEDEALDGEDSE